MIAVASKMITCRRCGHRFDAGIIERGQSVKCPDCTEHFKVDGRSFAKHNRTRLPLGHIRIAQKSGTLRRREIKVRNARGGSAWTPFARWWWEQNKGPIPLGQRVYHIDGDTLNDDPSNYALGGWADGIAMKAMVDPAWWAEHIKKMRRGTAEHNRLRGAVKRARSWNPSQWYPVDLVNRQVINTPRKHPVPLLRSLGVELTTHAEAHNRRAIALGWPDLPCTSCCALACLIEGPCEMPRDVLLRRVNEFRALRGWVAIAARGMWMVNMAELSRRGFVIITRRHRAAGLVSITRAAIDARSNPCPFIVVRGSRLGDEPFKHFTKVNADRTPIGRSRSDGMSLLAQAISGDASLDEIACIIDESKEAEPLLLD